MEDNKVNIFEQATRKNLLFATSTGVMTTSDLWNLSLERLKTLGKIAFNTLADTKTEKSAFDEDDVKVSKEEVELQLKFDIIKSIYETKKAEKLAIDTARETKEHNQKILSLIAEKQEGALKESSIEDLRKLLK